MARLVLKWRYIKSGTPKHGSSLVKYIATRDGVEKCDESWKSQPATKEQQRLVQELIKEFPDAKQSFEYQDYAKEKTKFAASEFIERTIEENIDRIGTKENYVGYIAMRPRVEKQGAHGLFTQEDDPINLSEVAKEVSEHQGVVWTTVLSLRREDAVRLGYDNAKAWKDMLRGQADNLAKAMGIPLADLKWYAAFHNESTHPHVHIVSYSKGKEPYMTQDGLEKWKAGYAHEIFKQDLYHIYEEQTAYRNELRAAGKEKLARIVTQIDDGAYENETVKLMLKQLAEMPGDCTGKKVYGYLPKKAKNLINGIVDEIAKDARIAELYSLWYDRKEETVRIYSDAVPKRIPLSSNDELKTIRNAVIKEAMRISTEQTEEELPLNPPEEEPHEREWERGERHARCNRKTMWEFYFWGKSCLDKEYEEYNPRRAVELFMESAYRSNTVAKYRLGKMFLRGDEVKRDTDFAVRWLNEAIEDGNPYAAYLLGKELLNGEILPRDSVRAEALLRQAAAQGNKYAQYTLGKALLCGDVFTKDVAEAIAFLRASADRDFSPAQYVLGRLLYRGEEIEKDVPQALRYLERAAEKNNAAAYLTGKIYLTEDAMRDAEKALLYLERAAKEENDSAEYLLGKTYLFGKYTQRDYDKAVEFLQSAALHGNVFAKALLQSADEHNKAFEDMQLTNSVLRLFRSLALLLREKIEEKGKGGIGLTDKKLRRKIDEKKQAQGLKHG